MAEYHECMTVKNKRGRIVDVPNTLAVDLIKKGEVVEITKEMLTEEVEAKEKLLEQNIKRTIKKGVKRINARNYNPRHR